MQLTIRLPDEQAARIEQIAANLGLKKSDITRLAIKNFIESYEQKETKPYSKVHSLLGIANSGLPDLGQNHRKYLIDKIKQDKS